MLIHQVRDELANKLDSVTEISVSAHFCRTCRTVTERALLPCTTAGHQLSRVKAVKRFFRCRDCAARSASFNSRLPLGACSKCGGTSFEASSQSPISARHVDAPDVACRENLLPRGEEHAFSLKCLN